jgi:hypothetical protein
MKVRKKVLDFVISFEYLARHYIYARIYGCAGLVLFPRSGSIFKVAYKEEGAVVVV